MLKVVELILLAIYLAIGVRTAKRLRAEGVEFVLVTLFWLPAAVMLLAALAVWTLRGRRKDEA